MPATLDAQLDFAGSVVCFNLIPHNRDSDVREGPVIGFWENGLSAYAFNQCVHMLEAVSVRLDTFSDWIKWLDYVHYYTAGLRYSSNCSCRFNVATPFSDDSHTLLKRSMIRLNPDDFVSACFFLFSKLEDYYWSFSAPPTRHLVRDRSLLVDLVSAMPTGAAKKPHPMLGKSFWSFEFVMSDELTRRKKEKVRECLAPWITDTVCCHVLLPFIACAANTAWDSLTNV